MPLLIVVQHVVGSVPVPHQPVPLRDILPGVAVPSVHVLHGLRLSRSLLEAVSRHPQLGVPRMFLEGLDQCEDSETELKVVMVRRMLEVTTFYLPVRRT